MIQNRFPNCFGNISLELLGFVRKLNKFLTNALLLHLLQPHQRYSLGTDTSVHKIGLVPFQTNAENIRFPTGSLVSHFIQRKEIMRQQRKMHRSCLRRLNSTPQFNVETFYDPHRL